MKKLIIWGTGDIAEMAGYLFPLHTEYDVVAFCVDAEYATVERFMDRPVVSTDRVILDYPPDDHDMFVAIGYRGLNKVREAKYRQAKELGYALTSYISPLATVFPNVIIGDNCFIFENNVLQPFVRIGSNTVLWSGNHVGHHTVIGENCFITSHAVISGRVTIQNNVFIGVNATLRDHIRVESYCVVGAGVVLLKDASQNQVFIQESTPASRVPSNRLRGI